MADQPDPAAMQAAYGKIIAKAWTDEAFKKRLLSDPAAVLKEEGVEVSAGVTVKVVENTADTVHVVLPPRPQEGELSDEDLEAVAAGSGCLSKGGGFCSPHPGRCFSLP